MYLFTSGSGSVTLKSLTLGVNINYPSVEQGFQVQATEPVAASQPFDLTIDSDELVVASAAIETIDPALPPVEVVIPVYQASGTIDATGTFTINRVYSKLPGSIEVFRPYEDLSGTITVGNPVLDLPGSVSVSRDVEISGSITVVNAYASYLPGSINIKNILEISGSIQTAATGSISIPGSIRVYDELLLSGRIIVPDHLEVSGSVVVTNPVTLSGSITTTTPLDIPGSIITVESHITRVSLDASGSIVVTNIPPLLASGSVSVWTPLDIPGSVEVVKEFRAISGSIMVMDYIDLSGSVLVGREESLLSGTIEIKPYLFLDVSGSVVTEPQARYFADLSGTVEVRGGLLEIDGSIQISLTLGTADIPGAIIVTWPARYLSMDGSVTVNPHLDISGTILVERPSVEIPGSLTTRSKYEGNIGVDNSFAYDAFSYSKRELQSISGTPQSDYFEVNPQDEVSLELIEVLKISGSDIIAIDPKDDMYWTQYGDESAEWVYPIQLTDNTLTGNDYSLPSITTIDGKTFVSFNQNFEKTLNRVHVVNSQGVYMTPDEAWSVTKLYENAMAGQFVDPKPTNVVLSSSETAYNASEFSGTNGQMILNRGNAWHHTYGPQPYESNDFYESEITFTPDSYDLTTVIYQDLWETIQYQQQREGKMEYPAPQWNMNPMSEVIYAPEDNFDPIPKHADDVVTSDKGYYQDFNNFFAGNG